MELWLRLFWENSDRCLSWLFLYFIIIFYYDVCSQIFFWWHYNNGGLRYYSHMARSILLEETDLCLDVQLQWLEKKKHFYCSQFLCILYGMDCVGFVFGCENYIGIASWTSNENLNNKYPPFMLTVTISCLITIHLVLQHFQLALVDSTPCTLSKAESKYPSKHVHFY